VAETAKPSREAEILDAATRVFLRHGFRKTSMDEVARAAGLSRQALYLRFAGKRELFQATVERMIGQVRAAALAALEQEERAPADRLADALTALNGDTTGASGVVIRELLQETAGVSGPLLDRLRDDVTAAIADLLRRTGIAERWQDAGLTAGELAEHLYLIPSAVALAGQDAAEQRRALYTAARVIARGHPG
jgi:AcrR family transcriptional regulator